MQGRQLRLHPISRRFSCALDITNVWTDTGDSRVASEQKSIRRANEQKVVQRCMLMTTDPGDLVLDPTCGSGTTAYCRGAVGATLDHD